MTCTMLQPCLGRVHANQATFASPRVLLEPIQDLKLLWGELVSGDDVPGAAVALARFKTNART